MVINLDLDYGLKKWGFLLEGSTVVFFSKMIALQKYTNKSVYFTITVKTRKNNPGPTSYLFFDVIQLLL